MTDLAKIAMTRLFCTLAALTGRAARGGGVGDGPAAALGGVIAPDLVARLRRAGL